MLDKKVAVRHADRISKTELPSPTMYYDLPRDREKHLNLSYNTTLGYDSERT